MQHRISHEFSIVGPPDVALTFSATGESVRRALGTVRQSLRVHQISDVSLGTIEIVLAEACNNIVEHAYQDSGNGVIGLIARYCNGIVVFELSDSGQPMPGLEPPAKRVHDLSADLNDLPEGGFGWGLIRDMTKTMIYRRSGGRNLLRVTLETSICSGKTGPAIS